MDPVESEDYQPRQHGGEQVPVVCEIPVEVPYGSQIQYRAYDDDMEASIWPSKRSLTKVSLQLCTRSGRTLDLKQHNLTALFKILGHEYFAAD